jgi:putative transposase
MVVNDYYHRKSIRLRGYDYADNGLYFVTICVQHRECLLGHVNQKQIHLNDAGKMIWTYWHKLSDKYPEITIDESIIMPNHMHGILNINHSVGANPCIRPNKNDHLTSGGDNTVSPLRIPNTYTGLGQYLSWFKRMTTNEYIHEVSKHNWPRFDHRLWQRNFYEHIIRFEREYWAIKQYIQDNPQNWDQDELFSPGGRGV